MQSKPKSAPERLYTVYSFQGTKWASVNPEPVPRPAAALLVAAEWGQHRKARAVPHQQG
jgi:hypothetical protein